ncbi:hypothetical protein BLA29_014168, partial [Euroglyphus maynei]
RLPSYNRRCCKTLVKWLARIQWSNKTPRKNAIKWTSIKSNLFLQVMTGNQFGYKCGHLFFITKFKYIELLMMNFPLVVLFYEKICMNASF